MAGGELGKRSSNRTRTTAGNVAVRVQRRGSERQNRTTETMLYKAAERRQQLL